MRVATTSRKELGQQHLRFDPAFYLGRERARSIVNGTSSRQVRLGDIVDSIHDGARLPAACSGLPLIRLNNVRSCELDLSDLAQVDGSVGRWVGVRPGDVLFTRAAQPFRAAAARTGLPAELAVSSELAIIRPRPAVLPEYLAAILCTPTLNEFLRDLAYRGQASALPRLRISDIQRLPIPLPPRSLQESLGRQYQQAVQLTLEARSEIGLVAKAIHAEIDHRIPVVEVPGGCSEVRRTMLSERWDVPFNRGRLLRETLSSVACMRPLFDLARPGASSLRGLTDDEDVFLVQADDVNDATFLVEGGEHRLLADLSSRMRQRLEIGDVLMCTTGSGDQVAYLDDELEHGGRPILGSATLTILRFPETPRVFAVTLTHPLVRVQLRLLSSGSVQRFVNKRDLDELLVPVLGQVWREDFEVRLTRAMQQRREALIARAALIKAADDYLQEVMP
ncbi:MAG: hypothetical protein RBU45_08525 [Myxococcota bacterium]|jgi:hypothetical protein|nr:hypothetical protein [Myxococcota bacterium]